MEVKADGTIDIVWYDKRNGANDDQWDVYFATSTDGGLSFSANQRVTSSSFATPVSSGTPPEPWLGEYLGLGVDSQFAYIGYTAGTATDANGDIFFDRVSNPGHVVPELHSFLIWTVALALAVLLLRRTKA
jgi:hypothetical protein